MLPTRRAATWLAAVGALLACRTLAARTIHLQPGDDVAAAVAAIRGPAVIRLRAGEYRVTSTPYADARCANCENPATPVAATRGLLVTGSGIRIEGAGAERTILRTEAGYGVLFDRCRDCALSDVTITGALRDADGNASNGAVVVKDSRVTVERCVMRDNIGDHGIVARHVSGVMGVVLREGSDARIEACRILRNSWDGIAMYRESRGTIVDNVVDGIDAARGKTIGGGRGVGIGMTWDAQAVVRGNLVRRYWKGIGAFVDARADVRGNVVEDVLTWGLSLWDAGRGAPQGTFVGNAVHGTGACGVMILRSQPLGQNESAALVDNVVTASGRDSRYDSGEPYCPQEALALVAVPAAMRVQGNVLASNREAGGAAGRNDIPREHLSRVAARILEPLSRGAATRESAFVRELSDAVTGSTQGEALRTQATRTTRAEEEERALGGDQKPR